MLGLESRPRPWSEPSALRGGALLPLRAALFGLAVPLLLRRRLERLAGWLEAATAPRGGHTPQSGFGLFAAAEEMAGRVDAGLRAAWPLVRRGCLTRGLTRLWFLRRAGFPVSLRFGIGEVDGRLEGHCWLVLAGEPLAEPRDPRAVYTETWRIPRAAQDGKVCKDGKDEERKRDR
jgi:hypothetical protein